MYLALKSFLIYAIVRKQSTSCIGPPCQFLEGHYPNRYGEVMQRMGYI